MPRQVLLISLIALLATSALAEDRPVEEQYFTRVFSGTPELVYNAALRALAKRNWKLLSVQREERTFEFQTGWGWRIRCRGIAAVLPFHGDTQMTLVLRTHGRLGFEFPANEKEFHKPASDFFATIEREMESPSALDSKLITMLKNASRTRVIPALKSSAIDEARPAMLAIAGAPDKVKAALISIYAREGFAIAMESEHQISFWKDIASPPDFLTYMLVGDFAPQAYRFVQTFILAPYGEQVEVTATAEYSVQDGRGFIRRYLVTTEPPVKRELERLLAEVKMKAETLSLQAR